MDTSRWLKATRSKAKASSGCSALWAGWRKGAMRRPAGAVRDWKRLGRAKVVLAEIEDRSGPRQAKGYLSRYRRWK
ncbi:hypothetical protein [Candidatus Hakubella thermalkaliphila]|uniref:hypothetical protein n=1 Tax=Candidatus Hakubella thermalkaliphila TaxID=2754717 RepID=UPI001592D05B|nr:hypothetical protein [Candidatus Hakubella thermalkaliphila]